MKLIKNNTCLPTGELILKRTDDYLKSLMFFSAFDKKEGRTNKIIRSAIVRKEMCLKTGTTKIKILETAFDGRRMLNDYQRKEIWLNDTIEDLVNCSNIDIPTIL